MIVFSSMHGYPTGFWVLRWSSVELVFFSLNRHGLHFYPLADWPVVLQAITARHEVVDKTPMHPGVLLKRKNLIPYVLVKFSDPIGDFMKPFQLTRCIEITCAVRSRLAFIWKA